MADVSRRSWLASVAMGIGLALSYGTLAVQGVLFLLPERLKPRTRKLFTGNADQYEVGSVRSFYDLEGNLILVSRTSDGFQAFSSTCPHLGCRVHWEADKRQFFCPCHNGVFDVNGAPVSGPPADGGQHLYPVSVEVDASGAVFMEVKDVKRRRT
ncbi:MAG: Rieske (2Fe-2S) protein [candidate division Zixibacteria bacterium]|nr:Rieske (2Fe-2S) protein [candidate division Zixibacteria bacterium]